jgi:hypothetical protein
LLTADEIIRGDGEHGDRHIIEAPGPAADGALEMGVALPLRAVVGQFEKSLATTKKGAVNDADTDETIQGAVKRGFVETLGFKAQGDLRPAEGRRCPGENTKNSESARGAAQTDGPQQGIRIDAGTSHW